MGTRSRLFASAAFPLLSLSLMFQPAHATAFASQYGGTTRPPAIGEGFEVAQQQAPQAEGDDQDPRKRRKHEGEGQQGQGQQPEQRRQPAGEANPGMSKPEMPKPEPHQEQARPAPATQPEAQPEPSRQHKQDIQRQEAQPSPAAEPQAPAELKKQRQENAGQQPAQPEAAPQPEAQPGAVGRKMKEAEQPTVQQPAVQQEQAKPSQQQQDQETPRKKRQKPQEQPAEPMKQAAPAQPGEAPAPVRPPVPKAPSESRQAQPGTEPAPAQGKAPAPQQPAGETAAPPKGNVKPAQQGQVPASSPTPAAPENGATPQGGQAEGGQQAQGAAPAGQTEQVSPQELERRKKIAENPADAKGPVILPVQNGAAVLDSDKDAARRGGYRQGGRGQGQGGQFQSGQAMQGQNAQPPENVKVPTSDADAQQASGGQRRAPMQIEAVTRERGQRLDGRPDFARPDGARVEDSENNRVILNIDNNVFVRHDDTQRFTRDGERPSYEQLSRDRYRETIDRPDGNRIVTVRNRYGDIVQRSRIDARGREYVLFYSPELEDNPDNDDYFRDPGEDLPPMRLRIPLNQYIIDTSSDQDQDYYDFLREPPVEPVERVYSLNEVRYSARIRDKVRRIDLDTITFATGSAEIPMSQAKTLRGIADAMGRIIKNDPTETFLIEGHTDAVGSDQSNLILSDERAESVANVLTDVYGIPPENLATQGYGEQYLKVNTQGPEQENRRVTIRRVTALVRPVASRQ